ncbi:amino acid adenylation domain-containing protein [Kutzneria kofuensis]|uniref:Amino acid adenylation domain-containing protein n=1 Tax=Kutzneria kofuensis TaxID=103725 RepID=A0A7W9KSW4_9PSEU|nr:non-ribosomal peptide synthetase [Kutzneria kofuensis]MBB5898136.1 amino acid adenylation domain-containing protein [Kutzneria kofuensis]
MALPGPPLGPHEEALWLLQRLAPDRGVSNVAVSVTVPGAVRWWSLNEAFGWLVARHEPLRSTFPLVDGRPTRMVTAAAEVTAGVDVAMSTADDAAADLRRYAGEPFDLDAGLPVRVGLFTLADGRSLICLVAHHLVVDHSALRVLVTELMAAYQAFADGRDDPGLPPPAAVPVVEPPSDEAVRYWRDQVAGTRPGMQLRDTRPAPAVPTFAGDCLTCEIPSDTLAAVDTLRRELRVTPNIVLLSAYYLLLLRQGAGPDMAVGVMLNARPPGAERALGYRVDTVPLRVRADPDAGFADLVAAVRDAFLAALAHPRVSYESLTGGGEDDAAEPGAWRARLFRHLFNFRPTAVTAGDPATGLEVSHVDTGLARFDLELSIDVNHDRTLCQLVFSTEVHDRDQAGRYLAQYVALLRAAAAAPGEPVRRLDMRTPADHALTDRINRTDRRWPGPATVAGLVSRQALSTPDDPAVVDAGVTTTYRRLLAAANAMRERLARHGVGAGDVVAVAGPRSARTAAALLGIWAAGAAYLPLDPGLPAARVRHQLTDSGCQWVVDGPGSALGSVDPADCAADPAPLPEPDPAAPAYLIYTSGSSGPPKGVRLTHGNLRNVVGHFAELLAAGADDAMPWLTTLTFDISALELWLPLATGGRVVVVPDDLRADPRALTELLAKERVTVVQATPTTWRRLAPEAGRQLHGLRVLCGGEPLSPALARQLLDAGCRLYNVYGPTETTIWSTVADIEPDDDQVTVGRPIANTRVHVLDDDLAEVPTGQQGELCIGGDGVALGYVNLPAQTAAAFHEHPRLGRIYRTGDVARLRPDGSLELLGRRDRQVKLRAHRIELGEVESALETHPAVRAAAVIMVPADDGEDVLAAFVVPDGDGCDREDLWRHATEQLPGYAVPARIAVLDRLPETPSGKVDHRHLAAMTDGVPARSGRPVEPADELTGRLVELWRTVLALPGLDADANFFLSGGHSLRALELAARASEVCGERIELLTIFQAPTPARLAGLVRQRREAPGARDATTRGATCPHDG